MNLHQETETILHEMRKLSGRDFEFIERETSGDAPDVMIKIARKSIDRPHYIFYNENKYLSYLIAGECGHIKRTYESQESKRLIPYVTADDRLVFQKMNENDPVMKLYKRTTEHPETMLGYMQESIVAQIANIPVDLQIERWLFEEHNGLQYEQMEYNETLNSKIQSGVWFNRGLNSVIPELVHDGMLVMNRAFFQMLTDIFNFDYARNWKKHFRNINKGPELETSANAVIKLLDHLHFGPDDDTDYVDRLATHFGCRDIYSWRSFEIIPDHFYDEVDNAKVHKEV